MKHTTRLQTFRAAALLSTVLVGSNAFAVGFNKTYSKNEHGNDVISVRSGHSLGITTFLGKHLVVPVVRHVREEIDRQKELWTERKANNLRIRAAGHIAKAKKFIELGEKEKLEAEGYRQGRENNTRFSPDELSAHGEKVIKKGRTMIEDVNRRLNEFEAKYPTATRLRFDPDNQ